MVSNNGLALHLLLFTAQPPARATTDPEEAHPDSKGMHYKLLAKQLEKGTSLDAVIDSWRGALQDNGLWYLTDPAEI